MRIEKYFHGAIHMQTIVFVGLHAFVQLVMHKLTSDHCLSQFGSVGREYSRLSLM